MNKRVLSLMLLAALLLSACGSDAPAPSGDTTAATADTTVGETISDEYKVPDVDYGGATFTILDYDTEEYFWQAATYSDIRADEESGEPVNDAQYKRNLKVQELLNIKLETYPVGSVKRDLNHTEFRKLVIAGEDVIDAGFVFANTISTILAEPDLVYDLNDITTIDTSASWWDQNAALNFTYNGALKTITGDISLYTTFAPILYYFNKNLAESFKLPDLYDMTREGKWTIEKMYEYSRLVAQDLNGDSTMDENDRFGTAVQRGLLPDLMIGGGLNYTRKNAKGEIELTLNTEKTISLVETCVPFLNDDKVNCIANLFQNKYSNPFYEMHLPMFKNDAILFNFNQILIAFELRAMEADYGILPTPKFDEKQEGYHTPMSLSWSTLLCVPVTNTRLEMTGHVLDALGFYSQQYVTNEFIDTTVRTKSLRDDDSAEMLELVLDNKVWDMGQVYNWGKINSEFQNLGNKNNTNFASMWASIESTVKTEMQKSLEMMK